MSNTSRLNLISPTLWKVQDVQVYIDEGFLKWWYPQTYHFWYDSYIIDHKFFGVQFCLEHILNVGLFLLGELHWVEHIIV